MSNRRRHPGRLFTAAGAILAIQSIFWEVVRMRPDYRFIVEPWAIRGYDTPEVRSVALIGVALLVLSVLAWRDTPERGSRLYGGAVAAAVWLFAVLLAANVIDGGREATLNSLFIIFISIAAAFVVVRVVINLAAPSVPLLRRRFISPFSWILLAIVGHTAVFRPALADTAVSYDVWMVPAIGFGAMLLLAVTAPPSGLAVNRVLILSAIAGWIVSAVTAGPLRSTLLRLQLEGLGVSAQFKDTQITWGLMLAFIGMGLVFVGGVALWAERRDQLAARRRAAQQQRAAEESLAELETSKA